MAPYCHDKVMIFDYNFKLRCYLFCLNIVTGYKEIDRVKDTKTCIIIPAYARLTTGQRVPLNRPLFPSKLSVDCVHYTHHWNTSRAVQGLLTMFFITLKLLVNFKYNIIKYSKWSQNYTGNCIILPPPQQHITIICITILKSFFIAFSLCHLTSIPAR